MKDGIFPGSDNDEDTSVYPLNYLSNCKSNMEDMEVSRMMDEGNPNVHEAPAMMLCGVAQEVQ